MTETVQDNKFVELKYQVIDEKTSSALVGVDFPRTLGDRERVVGGVKLSDGPGNAVRHGVRTLSLKAESDELSWSKKGIDAYHPASSSGSTPLTVPKGD